MFLFPFVAATIVFHTHADHLVMDGQFDDWAAVPVTIVDPADAPGGFVDVGEVRLASDARFVYLLVDFGRVVNAQGFDGHAMILLDADGDPATGKAEHGLPGTDLIIDLTPPNIKNPTQPGVGMAIRSTTYTPDPNDPASRKLIPYDIDLHFGPTHAGQRMEFRLDRGVTLPATPALFTGAQFTAKLVCVDLSGKVIDETEPVSHPLATRAPVDSLSIDQPNDPLAPAPGTSLRVMCWNAERGAILTRPLPYVRSFNALKPDVILLQELTDKNSAEQIVRFMQAIPGQENTPWNVIFGSGGGDLRTAVVTRLNLQPVKALQTVSHEDRPERTIRVSGGIIESDAGRLLAVSLHLKCCGRAGDSSDETRKQEVRQIHAAIKAAMAEHSIDGVVIAGDFNLVGSRDPVEMVAAGLDIDQSALSIADAYQLDGLTNATWADPDQPFAPGRLDYILFTDQSLRPMKQFVFESGDLSTKWQRHHGIASDDSAEASDHFPVVVDFQWISP